MRKFIVVIAISFAAAALLIVAQPRPPAMGNRTVVVELFTSQGCSSCPPADQLIGEIERDSNLQGKVIPLAFHVDYWNQLGWTDPYSSAEWSRRQSAYVRALNLESPYTPQAIVDGSTEFVGSDRRAMYNAIAKASHDPAIARVAIDGKLVHGSTSRPLDLFAAVVRGDAPTAVKAGENSGRTLHNEAIVRKLTRVARVNGDFTQPAGDANVVFLQDPKTLAILAAARFPTSR